MVRALAAACLMLTASGVWAAPSPAKLSPLRIAVIRGEDNADMCDTWNDNAPDTMACAKDAQDGEPKRKDGLDQAFDAGLWQAVADHFAEVAKADRASSVRAAFATATANAVRARNQIGLSEADLRRAMKRTAETDKVDANAN